VNEWALGTTPLTSSTKKKEKRLTFLLSKSKKVCSARFLPFYEFSVFYFFVIFSTSTGGLKKKKHFHATMMHQEITAKTIMTIGLITHEPIRQIII
jgi:hypothetical protein